MTDACASLFPTMSFGGQLERGGGGGDFAYIKEEIKQEICRSKQRNDIKSKVSSDHFIRCSNW